MSGILGAVIVVGGVGIIIAVILVVAGKFFAVEVNERKQRLEKCFREITVVDAVIRDVMV